MPEKKTGAAEGSASGISPAFNRKARAAETGAKKKAADAGLPAETDSTVTVCLNRPLGLYFKRPDGSRITLNGNDASLIGKEKGILSVGTFGETILKKSDWEYILKTYGSAKIFKNGLCFAAERGEDARAEAQDRKDLRSGLEPVNPKKAAASKPADSGE